MMWSSIIGHKQEIARLRQVVRENRLVHAYLFVGEMGIGKHLVAKALAKDILCQTRDSCGGCHQCKLVEADSHPDLVEIKEGVKDITIGEIRALQTRFHLKSDNHKIAIIDNAEKLNAAAANSMLKILEEPPENTHFFLITSRSDLLPATIRSRCQKVAFAPPTAEECASHLTKSLGLPAGEALKLAMLANGRIGFAQSFPREVIQMVLNFFAKVAAPPAILDLCAQVGEVPNNQPYVLLTIARLLRDALVYKITGSNKTLAFPEASAKIALTRQELERRITEVLKLEPDLDTTYNKQLMFEQLLLNV